MRRIRKKSGDAGMTQTMKYIIGVIVLVILITIGGVFWYMEATKPERDALNGSGLDEEEYDDEGGLKVEESGSGGTIDMEDDDKKENGSGSGSGSGSGGNSGNLEGEKEPEKETEEEPDFGRIF